MAAHNLGCHPFLRLDWKKGPLKTASIVMLHDAQRGSVVPARRQDQVASALTQGFVALATISILLFWSSAIIGVWAAYNRTVAVGRFGLISVGLGLILLLCWQQWHSGRRDTNSSSFTIIGVDSAFFAGGLGLLFLLTHDWQRVTEQDFTLLPKLTGWIQLNQPGWGKGLLLHENLIAGALIGLLPLAIIALWQRWSLLHKAARYGSLFSIVIGGVTLLLTFSRGAWLGLLGGSLLAFYLYWRTNSATRRRGQHQQRSTRSGSRQSRVAFRGPEPHLTTWHLLDWSMGLSILLSIGLLVGMTISPSLHELLLRPFTGTYLETTVDSRLAVWQESIPLIEDYLFTGSGLGSTPMVLATYVYLLHVPYLNHAHSLYLQIAVEQGLPGLIGFIGIVVSAIGLALLWLQRGNREERRYAFGALTAQFALLIYGATDAELYASLFVPLLFLPTALLIATAAERPWHSAAVGQSGRPRTTWAYWLGAMAPVVVLLIIGLMPSSQSHWLANQTTVAQTRQELRLYRWPAWPIQDAVRRSELVDTTQWVAQYEAILHLDPTNVTALRRVGQIMLSLGDYQQAHERLAHAYQLAPQQRATRQLLGEAHALLGDEANANLLWQSLDLGQGQLELRRWWYEQVDGDSYAKRFAQGVATWQMQ